MIILNFINHLLSSGNKGELTVDLKIKCIVIGFFNGVNVPKIDADKHLKSIQNHFSNKSPSNKPIQYQLFYNDSYGLILDLVETFDQRTSLLELNNHYELFWEMIYGNKNELERATANIANGSEIEKNLWKDYLDKTNGYWSNILSNPIAEKKINTSLEHRKIINQLLKDKQQLVLIAHSQGNLYGLQAYVYSIKRSKNISIVHIAPPIDIIKGEYVLSSQDMIINSMRIRGHILPANIDMPSCNDNCNDLFGHGFAEVYFNSKNEAGRKTEEYIKSLLK